MSVKAGLIVEDGCRLYIKKKKKKKKKKKDHNDVLEKPGKITKFVKTALETAKNRITKTRKAKEQTLAEKHSEVNGSELSKLLRREPLKTSAE